MVQARTKLAVLDRMHIPTSTPTRIWERALVWSEHDTWMARRRTRHAVLTCIAIVAMAAGFVVTSYASNQAVLAALFPHAVAPTAVAPTATAPVGNHPPCDQAPPCAWSPAW